MRRARHVAVAVVGGLIALAAVAACTPDVVSVSRANASEPVPVSAPIICGEHQDQANPALLLTAHDIWPRSTDAGKIASEMSLDDAACSAAVAATTAPAPLSCEVGFPWYASQALPTALASLGVTRVRESELLQVRADRSVSAQVSEYVLTLRGSAAAAIEQTAVGCDAVQAPTAQPPVYTTRDSGGGISVAVQVGYDIAVGLTFTGGDLNDATKLALLDKAVDLASRAAPNG
jgi:hypothetical protein